jgi:hypothetical protein
MDGPHGRRLDERCKPGNVPGASEGRARARAEVPKTICDRINIAFLPVAVAMNMNSVTVVKLQASLSTLGAPIRLIPGAVGAAEEDLGILFADDVPKELVCNVRTLLKRDTGANLTIAVTSAKFSEKVNGATGPAFGIQVGFPFRTHLHSG